MAKKKAIDWPSVRADCLSGVKDRDLAHKYGISVSTISRRRKAEDWRGEVAEEQDWRELEQLRAESNAVVADVRERFGLTAKAALFAQEYLVDLNGTRAARRAGYSENSAGVIACELLKKPNVAAAINELMESRQQRTQVNADMVLGWLATIATADPSEISQMRLGCCRYCWGEDFKYQYVDEAEEQEDIQKAKDATKANQSKNPSAPEVLPQPSGGYGFNHARQPHPECPKCLGEGRRRAWFADTRKLSPSARLLFDGVEMTKEGLKVKTLSRENAITLIAKHLNMLGNVRVEHSGKDGGPIDTRVTADATPEVLRAINERLPQINQKLEDEC